MAKPRTVRCRVRTFEQHNTFGSHVPGDVVEIDAKELEQPAIRRALISLDEEEQQRKAREEEQKAEARARLDETERERAAVIDAQARAKERAARRSASQ